MLIKNAELTKSYAMKKKEEIMMQAQEQTLNINKE